MRIAVSGANGFVGRRVLDWLSNAGHVAVPLVRKESGLSGEVVVGDLSIEPIAASALSGVNAVIHLAARTHVARKDPASASAYYQTNVTGTKRLLSAAADAGVSRFVYLSSIKASGEWTAPGAPFTPDMPPQPQDAYGSSKLEAEVLVRTSCAAVGMDWRIVRPPLVLGVGVKGNLDLLIRAVATGVPLPFAGISNRRSVIHVDNLADAVGRCATMTRPADKPILVCDLTLSTPDLILHIADALGRPVRLFRMPRSIVAMIAKSTGRQGQVDRLWGSLEIDSTYAKDVLDWRPSVDPITGLIGAIVSRSTAMGY